MKNALPTRTLVKAIVSVGVGYLLLGLLAFHFYQHQVNPDGISYISIAEHYLGGLFSDAINAYWSPLLSWIAAPLFTISSDHVGMMKVVMLLCGLANVVLTMLLAYKLITVARWRMLATILIGMAVSVVCLAWSLAGPTTPDLLYSAIFLLIAWWLLRFSHTVRWYSVLGVLGGLLYLSKAVGMYVFGALVVVLAVRSLMQPAKKMLALVAPAVCLVIIAPYVLAISFKYQQPTLGTTGNYNLQLVAPHTQGHPMLSRLLPPPNPSAISVWEDVSNVPVGNWNPLASQNDMDFALNNAVKSSTQTISQLQLVSTLFITLVVGLLAYAAWRWNGWAAHTRWSAALITGIATASIAPYLLLFNEERYMYHMILLVLVGSCAALLGFAEHIRIKWYTAFIALLVVLASFMPHSVDALLQNRRINANYFTDSRSLAPNIPRGSAVGSSTFASLYFCFYSQTRCFSTLPADTQTAVEQIKTYQLDYLLLYGPDVERLAPYLHLQQTGNATYFDMHLYKVTN